MKGAAEPTAAGGGGSPGGGLCEAGGFAQAAMAAAAQATLPTELPRRAAPVAFTCWIRGEEEQLPPRKGVAPIAELPVSGDDAGADS